MTYEEIKLLREKYFKNEISFEETEKIYLKNKPKNWCNTQDWKNRVKDYKKDKCEQCGGNEHLSILHCIKPRKYDKIKWSAFLHYQELFLNDHNATLETLGKVIKKDDIIKYIENNPSEVKLVCPICSGNFYTRRNAPIHVCNRCKYQFDEPVSKSIPEYIDDFDLTSDEILKILKLKKASIKLYSDLYQKINYIMIKDKYQKAIDRMALLDLLDQVINYLSFKDTKTYCRSCSYSYNINKMDLCPICNKNYKLFPYETCIDCLPDSELKEQLLENRKNNKEYREFEKEMDQIE
jgi:hypothetical protein